MDWNDATNACGGCGYTLLLGNAANGPGPAVYYHPFGFEYSTKNGTGTLTQFAIPYGYAPGMDSNIFMRGRYDDSWTAWVKIVSENLSGDIYVTNNCSALSFTDRTPAYTGDALAEIRMISHDCKGMINHATLPEFARHTRIERSEDGQETEIEERNIGNMVSILTKAVQQLTSKNEELAAKIQKISAAEKQEMSVRIQKGAEPVSLGDAQIYVDSENELKIKFSNGTVKNIVMN